MIYGFYLLQSPLLHCKTGISLVLSFFFHLSESLRVAYKKTRKKTRRRLNCFITHYYILHRQLHLVSSATAFPVLRLPCRNTEIFFCYSYIRPVFLYPFITSIASLTLISSIFHHLGLYSLFISRHKFFLFHQSFARILQLEHS